MNKEETIRCMQKVVAEADSIAKDAKHSYIEKEELEQILGWLKFAKIDAANAIRYYDYEQSNPQDSYYAAAIHLIQQATNALQKARSKRPELDSRPIVLESLKKSKKESDEKWIDLAILICEDDINNDEKISCDGTFCATFDYYRTLAKTLTE